ncbi:cellulose biosynthesis protein BcsF [Zhongshania marina]|uniref:Uncharacterized protein n=1 Tax=Zhongshania marina TaxID=2304603 RepID=A0ABX9W237_9GAMM|nr:hypothetical protein D0911_10585 [Zhongshania marina]
MNIDSFISTILIGFFAGSLVGYFAREVFSTLRAIIFRVYAKPRFLQPFDASDINQSPSSTSNAESPQ